MFTYINNFYCFYSVRLKFAEGRRLEDRRHRFERVAEVLKRPGRGIESILKKIARDSEKSRQELTKLGKEERKNRSKNRPWKDWGFTPKRFRKYMRAKILREEAELSDHDIGTTEEVERDNDESLEKRQVRIDEKKADLHEKNAVPVPPKSIQSENRFETEDQLGGDGKTEDGTDQKEGKEKEFPNTDETQPIQSGSGQTTVPQNEFEIKQPVEKRRDGPKDEEVTSDEFTKAREKDAERTSLNKDDERKSKEISSLEQKPDTVRDATSKIGELTTPHDEGITQGNRASSRRSVEIMIKDAEATKHQQQIFYDPSLRDVIKEDKIKPIYGKFKLNRLMNFYDHN